MDSVYPKQQLLSMAAGDGPHQHFRNHGKVIQDRLKGAAKKICCLSKEKQQLLEMVNRLRTELGEASKEGKLIGEKNLNTCVRNSVS